jgi:hypothetical protein
MSDDFKLSEESAAAQIDSLLDYYRIKLDRVLPIQGAAIRSDIIDSIRRGEVEVEIGADGIVVKQNLARAYKKIPNTIEYKEVSGRAKQIAMKLAKDADEYERLLLFVGYLTGLDKTLLPDLLSVDNRNMERLGTLLFLA